LSNCQPLEVSDKKKPSYRLQEDLELLLELSTYSLITNKSFEEIVTKKRIGRTLESMKSRYS